MQKFANFPSLKTKLKTTPKMKRLEIPEADLPTDLYEDDVFEKEKNDFGKPIKNIYANIYEENVSIMRFPLLYCRLYGPNHLNNIPFKEPFKVFT